MLVTANRIGNHRRVAWLMAAAVAGATWCAAPAMAQTPLALDEAEAAWLQARPKIRVGVMNAWPPFNFVDEQDGPRAIGADFIVALNRRLASVLKIVPHVHGGDRASHAVL